MALPGAAENVSCATFASGGTFCSTAAIVVERMRGPAAGADSAERGHLLLLVQTKSGPVGTMPITVSRRKMVQIAAPVTTGDKVFVMDAHTGEVASHPVSIALSGTPVPLSFVMADFQLVGAPAPAAPPSVMVVPPVQVTEGSQPSSLQRLVTGFFSLVLAGGVGWIIVQLVKTRGEPLRRLARRAGVEIPDSSAAVDTAAEEKEPPVYKTEKRVPEAVPDEAGLPPKETFPKNIPSMAASLGRGPALPLSDIPALVGLQGLAAGSTFALTDGDVVIGRDGDNGIVLAESTVSRRHARLLRDSQGQFTVSDLGSANGIYINGTRIQRAILSSGDELKIGDNYFRFQAARETL